MKLDIETVGQRIFASMCSIFRMKHPRLTLILFISFLLIALAVFSDHQKSSSASFSSHEDIASDRSPGIFFGEHRHPDRTPSTTPQSESLASGQEPKKDTSPLTFGTLQQQPGITSPGSIFFDGSTNFGGTDPLGTSMRSAGLSLPSRSPESHQGIIVPNSRHQLQPEDKQERKNIWIAPPPALSQPSASPRPEPIPSDKLLIPH
jgi:hypothetical protein